MKRVGLVVAVVGALLWAQVSSAETSVFSTDNGNYYAFESNGAYTVVGRLIAGVTFESLTNLQLKKVSAIDPGFSGASVVAEGASCAKRSVQPDEAGGVYVYCTFTPVSAAIVNPSEEGTKVKVPHKIVAVEEQLSQPVQKIPGGPPSPPDWSINKKITDPITVQQAEGASIINATEHKETPAIGSTTSTSIGVVANISGLNTGASQQKTMSLPGKAKAATVPNGKFFFVADGATDGPKLLMQTMLDNVANATDANQNGTPDVLEAAQTAGSESTEGTAAASGDSTAGASEATATAATSESDGGGMCTLIPHAVGNASGLWCLVAALIPLVGRRKAR